MLDYGMSPYEAVHSHRIHHQFKPEQVEVEYGTKKNFVQSLRDKGHNVKVLDPFQFLSSVQVIKRNEKGWIEAVSDERKRGRSDGY